MHDEYLTPPESDLDVVLEQLCEMIQDPAEAACLMGMIEPIRALIKNERRCAYLEAKIEFDQQASTQTSQK